MGDKTLVRSVATGALAAAMTWTGAGTAGATRGDVPYTASTATAVLGGEASTSTGEEFGLLSVVRVTAVKGSGTSLDVQLYRDNWSCEVSGKPTEAGVTTLESATAAGSFSWTCTEDESSGLVPGSAATSSGTASLQLKWTGTGEVEKEPLYHCVGRFLLRDADVKGELVLAGDLDARLTAAAHTADSYLAYDHHVCPSELHEPAP